MRAGRFELAAAAVLAAALVTLGAVFGGPPPADDARATTFSDDRRGLHALHLLLERLDAKPRRRLAPVSGKDAVDGTVVVAAPSEPVTARETAELLAWVRAGGRLVVAAAPVGAMTGASRAETILQAFGFTAHPTGGVAGVVVNDSRLAEGLGPIEWPPSAEIEPTTAPAGAQDIETLVASGGSRLAARRRFAGGGEIVVLADARLLDNDGLRRGDDAVLAVRLLSGRAGVEFDEFHHGFHEGRATDLVGVVAGLLVSTWPGRAALVLAFAAALWLAGAMVRLGAPDVDPPPARRALSEHAEALGRLFEVASARAETLKVLVAGARRAAGTPAALATPEFVRRLASSPAPGAKELADAVRRAAGARPAKDVEMARLAANLAAARRRYLHGR